MSSALFLFVLFIALPFQAFGQNVDELKDMLKERDATIERLQRRLHALEKEQAAAKAGHTQTPAVEDDEDLDRALERTLVQQGGLVLRPHTYELEPQAIYSHWDETRSSFHHELDAALAFRAGLPGDSQFQVRVPYVHVATSTGSATALGDVELSLSKQLWREKEGRPGLVGSVGWVIRSEDGTDGAAPTGSGFNVVQAGITAVKRHDPLVVFGGINYAKPLARDISGVRAEPGDVVGARVGTILAASPDTSLSLGLNFAFVGPTRIGGQAVPNSETTLGTLQLGFGMLLSRSVMFNLATDLRVSGSVPDFRISAFLPIRF